jgi:hypothetical protein
MIQFKKIKIRLEAGLPAKSTAKTTLFSLQALAGKPASKRYVNFIMLIFIF